MTLAVSMVASARETETHDAEPTAIFAEIIKGRWREPVEQIRAAYKLAVAEGRDPKPAVAGLKRQLPGVLWSGRFSRRAKDGLAEHSGLLVADVDGLTEDQATEASRRLYEDPHTVGGFISPTGTGLKVVFAVPADAASHGASFAAVRELMQEKYGLAIDESGKDLARLCFVSWDPAGWTNFDPVQLTPKPTPAPATLPMRGGGSTDESEAREALRCVSADCSRDEWLRIGMALQDGFGEAGKSLWREWSQTAADRFNERDFDRDWASLKPGGGVTIKTLFRLALDNGWRGRAGGTASGGRTTRDTLPGNAEPHIVETADARARVRGEIIKVLCIPAKELSATQKHFRIAKIVMGGLAEIGQFFFHAERRDYDSAMYFNRQTKRLDRVRSDWFGAWLSDWSSLNRADQSFRYVEAAVGTAALTGSETQPVFPESFWASRSGRVYLSTADGTLARISANRVELVDNGTDGVLFPTGRTLAPWRLTDAGLDPFAACSVFSGAKLTAGHGLDLARLWAMSLPTAPKSKPPLCLAGDVGSGKTRFAKGIAELYGLPFVATKVEDDGEDDFWPNADAGGLYVLDNADSRCRWLADTLANAATDGCTVRRKLYTNNETVTLRARAWLALTTANPTFASDAGLADRLLVARMGRRDGESSDAALTDEIQANRDAGLSFIAWTLARGLADTGPVPGGLNRRHPDFAAFAVRLGRAMGREAEAVAALQAAESDKAAFCLENDPVGSALLALLGDGGSFHGTGSALLDRLAQIDPDLAERWTAKRLGKRLSGLWPHVEAAFPGARKEQNRQKVTIYTLCGGSSAGCAGFQEVISLKPPTRVET